MDTVHKGNSVAVPRLRFFGIPERVTRKGDTELSHLPDKFSLYRVRFRWKHPNIQHLLRHCESNQTFDMKIEVSVIILLCLATANAQTHPSISSGSKAEDPVLVGAGDIASCDDLAGAYATAKLIDKISGTVFAAGDLAYPNGSDEDFAKCYGLHGGASKTEPARRQEIMNTVATLLPGMRTISVRKLAIRRRVITATISVRGTSCH